MATYYYNSSGAGDYLESDGVSRTWAAGSDANNGSSRLLPKLTPSYMGTATADKHIFNQGSYSFTTGGGRLIVLSGFEVESAQKTDDSVLLDFVGSGQTQAIRTNSVSGSATLTLGKGVTISGSGDITDLTWIFSTGAGKWVLNFGCKFRITSNIVRVLKPSSLYGFELNFTDGFGIKCTDAAVDLLACIELAPTHDSIVDIQHFLVDWTAGKPGPNLLEIAYPANPGGSFYTVLPHGSAQFNNAESLFCVVLTNPPDKSTAEIKYPVNFQFDNPSTATTFVQFKSPSANASQSNNCLIYRQPGNSSRVVTNAKAGFGFLLGDNSDADTNGIDGDIINVDFKADAELTGDIHGMMHGGSTGRRMFNRMECVGIGSLTKNGVAISVANELHRINIADGEYCFAKGCGANTQFIGDRCYVYQDTDAILTKATNSGLQDAQNPLFDGIQVIYKGGNFTGVINVDGDGTDTSVGTRKNMMIDSRLDLSGSTFFKRTAVSYTIAASEALVSSPFVNTLTLDQANSGLYQYAPRSSLIPPLIGSVISTG